MASFNDIPDFGDEPFFEDEILMSNPTPANPNIPVDNQESVHHDEEETTNASGSASERGRGDAWQTTMRRSRMSTFHRGATTQSKNW